MSEEDAEELEEAPKRIGRQPKAKEEMPELPKKEEVKVVERVVDLALINDKLNYIIGLLSK